MNETNVVIHAENLTKRFGKTLAVDQVSFDVPAGCVFALMGPNGAGKTTIIRMLLGLEATTAGAATVLGLDPKKDDVAIRRQVGYVPENHHMYPWMTVRQICWFCSAFYPTWKPALCDELLARFALEPGKKVKELSKGMVAKLALVLALAHEPKLLVLDEPTSGLDVTVRRDFLESIVDVITGMGRTVFFSSHLLADVERVADRVALLHQGRLRLVEDLESLKARVRNVRLTFADKPPGRLELPGVLQSRKDEREWVLTLDNFAAGTVERLRQELPGVKVQEEALGLEDIFVALVDAEDGSAAAAAGARAGLRTDSGVLSGEAGSSGRRDERSRT